MIFNSSGKILTGYSFQYSGSTLDLVKSYCYLGIEFTCSGTFSLARNNLAEKARKATFPIKSIISQFSIPVAHSMDMFNKMIRPIVLYNAENLAHLTFHQIASLETKKVTYYSI